MFLFTIGPCTWNSWESPKLFQFDNYDRTKIEDAYYREVENPGKAKDEKDNLALNNIWPLERRSQETRIIKAYKLDAAKLGCFEKWDINKTKV